MAILESIEYPLGEACRTGNIEIVEILVENGADVNLGSRLTPLSLVYFLKPPNWYNISVYLLENGASLDYESHNSEENVLTDIVGRRPGTGGADMENSAEVTMAFHYAIENCDHSKINYMQCEKSRINFSYNIIDVNTLEINTLSY